MMVRRFVEHLRNHDWFLVASDFVIVVLGVFIGIEVANWNEARQNRAMAESYLQRLSTDLGAEVVTWADALEYFRTTYRHAGAALQAFEAPVETLDEQFLIDLYQASQERNLSIRRATYDELVSTGGIQYLPGGTFREALGIHYDLSQRRQAVADDVTDYRPTLRRHMDFRVQDAIVTACGDEYVPHPFGYAGIRLPETCEIALPELLAREEIRRLHRNIEVKQHLRYQRSNLRSRIQALESALDIARNMRSAVQERTEPAEGDPQ